MFVQDTDDTPVIFRADRKDGSITAVFPTIAGSVGDPSSMSCFAHVGQHSACCLEWYRGTRPAKPTEYAELKRELESAPYGYLLKICRRITPQHCEALRADHAR